MFKKILFIAIFNFILVLSSPFVLATTTLLPDGKSGEQCDCAAVSVAEDCKKVCGAYSLNDIVGVGVKATDILLALSGSVALLFFIYGGVTFLISGGSSEKVSKGKQIIINSIIGLVIVFTSFMIIQFTMDALGYSDMTTWNQSK